jgi:hypothetical protein
LSNAGCNCGFNLKTCRDSQETAKVLVKGHFMRLIASFLVLAATAAGAQQAVEPARTGTPTAKKGDLNEMVCERQQVPGSRLASKRVCKTRAEWADLRSQDRMDVERAQTQRGMAPK